MNDYTRGQLDTIQIIREMLDIIADGTVSLSIVLDMLEKGAKRAGKARDDMDAELLERYKENDE
jgi:hypothetical protein